MKLNLEGIKAAQAWAEAGIATPAYDIASVTEKTRKKPMWIHFGGGNIFRVFLGDIANTMLEQGYVDRGIICAETFDYDIIDQIYRPFDHLILSVILHGDGRAEKKILAPVTESVKALAAAPAEWNRLKEIFASPDLQLASFTITEKGYALRGTDVKVCAVVGFPLGACTTATKVFETEEACKDGAGEIDMVLNVGVFKDGRYDYIRDDIYAVVEAAGKYNAIVKVGHHRTGQKCQRVAVGQGHAFRAQPVDFRLLHPAGVREQARSHGGGDAGGSIPVVDGHFHGAKLAPDTV